MIRATSVLVLGILMAVPGVHEATAQLGTVRGRVVEAMTGSGLPGATVLLVDDSGTQRGTASDRDGVFEMRRLPPGVYQISVRFIGFKPASDTLRIALGDVVEMTIRLETAERLLDEVVVEEDRREEPVGAGLAMIRPADLARVPMPDVTYDLAGYLLTLPGFVSTGDRGGQLFVRGGTPTQNLVLVDGIPVFQPFHIVGFYSAFPADIVAYADVYAGGFGAQYGGRVSSVIDIATRNGNKQQVQAAASVAPFLTSVRAEIPLSKNRVSLVTSWRESVIERLAPDLLGESLPFRFGDRFAKLHAFLSPTSSFSITGLQTFDEGDIGRAGTDLDPEEASPAEWKNEAVGYRYTYMPDDYAVVAEFAMYYSRMASVYEPVDRRAQRSDVREFTMAMDIAYLLGTTRVHFGLFGTLNKFVYDLGNRFGETRSGVTSGGIFIETEVEVGDHLRIEPGVRVETFSRGLSTSTDPRLRMTFLTFSGRQQWTLAYGRYHQQIVGLNNEQDVSDVFSVWAASPRALPVPQATHFLAGVGNRLTRWLEISVEGYAKKLENLSFPAFVTQPDEPQSFARVDGSVRGVDFHTTVTRPWIYLSLVYSLSDVTYEWAGRPSDNPVIPGLASADVPRGEHFDPPHDRTHQVNALVQVSRGPWRLSVRWQYGSGLPFTRINGFYDAIQVSLSDPLGYLDGTGPARISRGAVFDARLPSYHRLDVSMERDFRFEHVQATLQAGLINAYDRPNLFEYNFLTGQRVDQLPLLPSLGLKVDIR